VNSATIETIVSSQHRLTIAHLLSIRPRTLRELADATEISIQGVLKHLSRLRKADLLEEKEVKGARYLAERKVYSMKTSRLGDYSRGNLMIVNLGSEPTEKFGLPGDVYAELNALAEDVLIRKRRINDQARRLQRMIENLSESDSRLKGEIEMLKLDDEEKLIAKMFFTEDTLDEAAGVLSRYYGCARSKEAIAGVLAKVKKAG